MADLLCLPEHVLELIASKTTGRQWTYEDTWGAAAMTCKRLHNLQLPGEFAVVEDMSSLPWLMPRLKHATALKIDTCRTTYEKMIRSRPLRETVSMLLNASGSLPCLRTLVLRLTSDDERLIRPMVPWFFELILGASNLHTLVFDVRGVACPPILRRLPLQHLTLTVRSVDELLDVFEALSHCRRLKSLCVTLTQSEKWSLIELPRIDLSPATDLQHATLSGFVPGHSQAFLLPTGCALRVEGSSKLMELWSKSWVPGRKLVTVLSVYHTGTANQELPDPMLRAWPKGIEGFPALQHLQLYCVQMDEPLDLAVFARIPCLRICSKRELAVTIRKGSWQLLMLSGYCKFQVSIPDLHSFLGSVTVFVLILPSECMPAVAGLREHCRVLSIPLYKRRWKIAVEAGSARASSCDGYRRLMKLSNDEQHGRSASLDSSALMGVWPADPVASATARLNRVS